MILAILFFVFLPFTAFASHNTSFFGIPYLTYLIWPILIVAVIIGFVTWRQRKRGKTVALGKNWYLQLALSREDLVSQFLLSLAVLFFGLALMSFNRQLGDPFSWKTIILITSLVGVIIAYFLKAIYPLILGLVGMGIWWIGKDIEWIQAVHVKPVFILASVIFKMLFLYVIGRLHEQKMRWKRFAMVYFILSLAVITVILFSFSTKIGLSEFQSLFKGESLFGSWQISVSLFVFIVLFLGALFYAVTKGVVAKSEVAALIVLASVFTAIMFIPVGELFIKPTTGYYSSYNNPLSGAGIFWAALFNFLLVFELLGIIFLGYGRREGWLVNLGAFGFFAFIMFKYFDWFFTFLDKSVFFIGAGILLFGVGWLMEKSRRKMILSMKGEVSPAE
ncbi:MAG: hypothetical protein HYW34_00295 [Candidatus Brennerbacteria bacterium]|nr:hypothetical protein [Candidatus Brennerbacteria bacterium]